MLTKSPERVKFFESRTAWQDNGRYEDISVKYYHDFGLCKVILTFCLSFQISICAVVVYALPVFSLYAEPCDGLYLVQP